MGRRLTWYQKKKPKISGKQITVTDMTPAELLLKGGYKVWPRGYIKEIDETHRYHAFIIAENKIELHTDLFKPHSNKHIYHVASTYLCAEERQRLRKFMPPIPIKVRPKSKLTREEYLQAMQLLNS